MIDKAAIFEIHRLADAGLSHRQIAERLKMSRLTVKKYLQKPQQVFGCNGKRQGSKLDPYIDLIDAFLQELPDVRAPVVLQRLRDNGFDGQITIVRDCLRQKRKRLNKPRAFIRFESLPGKQIQVDWGHFGSLAYGNTKRKLYAMVMTECYSRMIFVSFKHSQKQEALHQALMDGFIFFGGSPEELVVDNMLTAVIERVGKILRFNDAFPDFLRPLKINPIACNLRAPWEKGKVENGVGYVRKNFWPLRSFVDLNDVQHQANHWRDTIANVRVHGTTGDLPSDRFSKVQLKPLPELMPDFREIRHLKVYKDFIVKFDANTYSAPPRMIGKRVTLKADAETVTIYYKDKKIATHNRSWQRKKRIENPVHLQQVRKVEKRLWCDRQIYLFTSLGQEAVEYLQGLADAGQPIKKSVSKLLKLKDEYGAASIIHAINKTVSHQAFGVDYIENILHQEMTPETSHQPVRLKDDALNRIRLAQPCLADYDAYIIKRNKNED